MAAGYPSPDPAKTGSIGPDRDLINRNKGFPMSQQISNWFKELLKTSVTVQLQSQGGYLDGTMMPGDGNANTIKFPIIGRTEVYKLTGGIEMVPTGNVGLSTVQVTMEDFEVSEWWTVQDAYKAGPSEKDALAKIIAMAIRRKRDNVKLDALRAFAALVGTEVTVIGAVGNTPDLLHFEQGRAEIAGAGAGDDEVFCPIPAMWMSQLCFYKEFADATWTGPDNAPFSKAQRLKMRTLRGITYIEMPDEHFADVAGGGQETFMWQKSAMGCEIQTDMENASMTQHTDRQGSPWLAKAHLSAAAIGIQGKAVKRFTLKKLTAPVRPA